MRSRSMFLLLSLSLGCATTRNTKTSSYILNGTWIPVMQQLGGQELPAAVFEKQKLTISDSNYTLTAESVDKGVLKYSGGKMDIYGKEGVNTGKHFTTIYKYENGRLTVCYNLYGDGYPDAFETKSKRSLFLSIYKKENIK